MTDLIVYLRNDNLAERIVSNATRLSELIAEIEGVNPNNNHKIHLLYYKGVSQSNLFIPFSTPCRILLVEILSRDCLNQ